MRCLDQTSLATPCEIVLHCASSQTFQSRSNSFYCQLCFLVGQDKDAPHLQTSCWSKGGYPCIVIFREPPQMSKQGGIFLQVLKLLFSDIHEDVPCFFKTARNLEITTTGSKYKTPWLQMDGQTNKQSANLLLD